MLRVELNQEERDHLNQMLSGGIHAARKLKRAQVLLAADAGESDETIANNVSVGLSTVYRTKRRFVLGNVETALSEVPRPGAERKLSDKQQALLVATACSRPPAGRRRWTLEFLAGAMPTGRIRWCRLASVIRRNCLRTGRAKQLRRPPDDARRDLVRRQQPRPSLLDRCTAARFHMGADCTVEWHQLGRWAAASRTRRGLPRRATPRQRFRDIRHADPKQPCHFTDTTAVVGHSKHTITQIL